MEVPSSDNVKERYPNYLSDESHLVEVDDIERIYFPRTTEELQEVVKEANRLKKPFTVSGGGTGIAGGRVPRTGWLIATDEMRTVEGGKEWKNPESGIMYSYHLHQIDDSHAVLRVPPSITVKAIQTLVSELGWFYPPDPTERSAFIGGNLATNASGARSFKYGATRNWVSAITVVLPDGECISLSREDPTVGETIDVGIYKIPRPNYPLPTTKKNVAGPVITDDSQPIDLFIGTDGIFGIISEVELKLIRPPHQILSIFVYCESLEQSFALIEFAQKQRSDNSFPIPMSVEFLDKRAVQILQSKGEVQRNYQALVILEQDVWSEEQMDEAVEYWVNVFEELDIKDTSVASSSKEIEHHKYLRHLIPETVNAIARKNNQPKLGTDYALPHDQTRKIVKMAVQYGEKFEQYMMSNNKEIEEFGYVLWAHAGDAHVHLNLLPRSDEERSYAKQVMIEFMQSVVEMGGTIAAEHGLGKKKFAGKPALFFQYGEKGLDAIKKMKLTVDPFILLNRGNLVEN